MKDKHNKKKRHRQAKRVKEPDKPSNMVTKVDKALSTENADQNFFEKPQMHEASRMPPPDASDENFFELMNSPSEIDVQEILKLIEQIFQEEFKNKWDKNRGCS